jgi:hypothetical protein
VWKAKEISEHLQNYFTNNTELCLAARTSKTLEVYKKSATVAARFCDISYEYQATKCKVIYVCPKFPSTKIINVILIVTPVMTVPEPLNAGS